MAQVIAVYQQDGRQDVAGLLLHKSAQAFKYFSERTPCSHHLKDSFLPGEQGLCALAVFDIDTSSIPLDDVSRFIVKRHAAEEPPTKFTVRPPHPHFTLSRLPILQRS